MAGRYSITGGDQLRDELYGQWGGYDGTDVTLIGDVLVKSWSVLSTVAMATAGTDGELAFAAPQLVTQPNGGSANARKYKVIAATFTAGGSITGDDTNNKTLFVKSYTQAGGSATTVASLLTGATSGVSGNLAAFQNIAITITAANVIVPINGTLTAGTTKGGTGVAIPAGSSWSVFCQVV